MRGGGGMWSVLLVAVLTQLALRVPHCMAIADSLVVRVPGGRVQGNLRSGAIHFLGIPYGTAYRFQYPSSSVQPWGTIRNGSHPGDQCPQHCPSIIRDLYCLPDHQMSESCLTLNIFRPAYNLPWDQAFPVMVFIHGGGFQSGSGGAPLYTGDYLARVGGVIVVTINYRLGAFGFLPVFNSYDDVIGNFGFLDQQMALEWVKHNIANFDGDPNKVTLVGEEAGCQSVGLHLTSSNSQPLFHSAILHSCPLTMPFRTKEESHQIATDFAKALGCHENDVTCLRAKSMAEILRAQGKVSDAPTLAAASLRRFQVWGPIVDKSNVHDSNLLQELSNANMAKTKPVMVGFVSGEGIADVYRNFPLPVSSNYFHRLINSSLPDQWSRVAGSPGAPYYSRDQTDARPQMVRFLNDFLYVCPAHRFAGELAGTSMGASSKVWMYTFDPKVTWSPGGSSWPRGGERYCRGDACQGLDLLYLFRPHTIPEPRRVSTARLTKAMAFYWTNFAKFHNPNRIHNAAVGPPSREGPAVQGSLSHRGRGIGFVSPRQPASVDAHLAGPFHLPVSFQYLVHAAGSPGRSSSFSPGFPSPLQRQRVLGVPPTFLSPHSAGSAVGSLLMLPRHPPPVRAWPRYAAWPAYVTRGPVTSSNVKATLVLTQPSPHARWSPFDNGCGFWEHFGFS